MGSLKKTLVIELDRKNPAKKDLMKAASVIKNGGLVVFPTETVYGIAANLLDDEAVRRLYRVKKRPKNKPFTVHISGTDMVKKMGCEISGPAGILIKKFWPGPLTLILKSKKGAKVGFRMPADKIALKLIKLSGVPVVAPSANISGKDAPGSAANILRDLDGKVDILLDCGRTKLGVESTIVDLSGDRPEVLREGAIKKKTIKAILKNI